MQWFRDLTGDAERQGKDVEKKYRAKRGRNARLLQDLKDEMKDNEEPKEGGGH